MNEIYLFRNVEINKMVHSNEIVTEVKEIHNKKKNKTKQESENKVRKKEELYQLLLVTKKMKTIRCITFQNLNNRDSEVNQNYVILCISCTTHKVTIAEINGKNNYFFCFIKWKNCFF